MKTKKRNSGSKHSKKYLNNKFSWSFLLLLITFMLSGISASAHCDSYDGPVIKDAFRALKADKVELVYKWIDPEQEEQIASLFKETYKLKNGDQKIYAIVEKQFLETLVRLHRETEGEPYTGLKPVGSLTPLIALGDESIAGNDVDGVVKYVNTHIDKLLRVRHAKVVELSKTKDDSVEQGRAYVKAYVLYTHTLEKLEQIINEEIAHSEVNSHEQH